MSLAGLLDLGDRPSGADLNQIPWTWLGLVGLANPLRPGVKSVLAQLRAAGIETLMLTDDQQPTALAIAEALDLGQGHPLGGLDATELVHLPPDALPELCNQVQVFARISPAASPVNVVFGCLAPGRLGEHANLQEPDCHAAPQPLSILTTPMPVGLAIAESECGGARLAIGVGSKMAVLAVLAVLLVGSVTICVTLTQALLLAPLDGLHSLLQLPWGIVVLAIVISWLLGE